MEALRGRRVVLVSGGWRHTAAADDAGNTFSWGWNKARTSGSLVNLQFATHGFSQAATAECYSL